MLQVASHPTSFAQHGHSHHRDHRRQSYSAPAPVQLPRTLARPPFADIARDALVAAAPELSSVNDEFIRHGLRSQAAAMLAGISTLAPSHLPQSLPRKRLPKVLSVPFRVNPQRTAIPTHALAISPALKSGKEDVEAPTTLYPIHAVVLAAHCTKLPAMPPAVASPSAHSAALPVLPLALPSVPAFAILHNWLYSGRLDTVFSSLFPNGGVSTPFIERLAASYAHASSPASPSQALVFLSATLDDRRTLHALATNLCATSGGNLQTLMTHAGHVKELWQDMVALGICDAGLWATIDVAWEVVLAAMNLAAQ